MWLKILIYIDWNLGINTKISFLDEKVFYPFLEANVLNNIVLPINGVDCNDCRSYWIKMYSKFIPKFVNLKCDNGREFSDNLNFANCVTD